MDVFGGQWSVGGGWRWGGSVVRCLTCALFAVCVANDGYSNALRQALAAGDELVVGLIGDEEVLANKGSLPVMPFEERLTAVQACKFVHEVIWYVATGTKIAGADVGCCEERAAACHTIMSDHTNYDGVLCLQWWQ